MEQNESQKNAGNSCAKNDGRTFLIAFLTSVIVLALYHFGTGVFAIFSGKSDYCTIPVAREYVLVPVSSMPQPCMGGMMGPGPGKFHHGGFRHGGFHRGGQDGEHGGMHCRFGKCGEQGGKHGMHRFGKFGKRDGEHGGMHHHGGHGHHHPGAPAKPDAAPAKPAPAPEAAPVKPDAAPAKPAPAAAQ